MQRQLMVEQNKVAATEKALKKLELKVAGMVASERAKVAREKEELQRQLELQQNKTEVAEKLNISSFKSQAAAEKLLKKKECETVERKRQMKALDIEKTKMQNQLEGVKRKLSHEENKSAAAKEELNSEASQLALVKAQLQYEQGQRKAAEEEFANNLKKTKSKLKLEISGSE